MTGEIHGLIVRAGIVALRKLSSKERKSLMDDFDCPDEYLQWVYDHPEWRTKSEENIDKYLEKLFNSPEIQRKIKKLK